jgi:hypothetical protein
MLPMKGIYNQGLQFALLALLCCLFACKKSSSGTGDEREPRVPIKTEKGTPVGTPTQKTIDASGGTISTPDGAITVSIPAGAVSTATNFSIQPITNTLENRQGKIAYRLSPEGTHFSKPVKVTFRYSDTDFQYSAEDALIVVWQTAEGAWRIEPTALDKSAKTLTVNTTHFSDWASSVGYRIHMNYEVLAPGKSKEFRVEAVISDGDDTLLAPLGPIQFMEGLTSINWKVIEGPQGKLVPESFGDKGLQARATYTAPDKSPGIKDVVVSVELKGKINILDDKAPGGVRQMGQMILLAPFKIAGSYMTGKAGSAEIDFSEVAAVVGGGKITITGGSNDASLAIPITVSGTTPGTYTCGDINKLGAAVVWLNTQMGPYFSQYEECGPSGGVKYSSGQVVISKVGKVGEMVEGSFSGMLYKPDGPNCQFKNELLNIKFSAKRGE